MPLIPQPNSNPNDQQIANDHEAWVKGTISESRTYFHATPHEFPHFAPFQHFGDQSAAEVRAEARSAETHRTIEVWLAIRKPWKIFDDQAANQVSQLVAHAFQEGLFDQVTRDTIIAEIEKTQPQWHASGGDYSARKWQMSMTPFANELKSRGYDGLAYENAVEGGISYVPFSGDQIWWVERDDHEP